MQKFYFIGNLVRDVETKQSQNGNQIAKFCVAVQRPYKKDTADFFEVVAYNKLGELCSNYLSKGRQVAVIGYMTTRTYEKDGTTRKIYEVVAEDIRFLDRNSKEQEQVDENILF